MQKIIPFKKEVVFKNTIEEITSISMDHHLVREEYAVKGDFIVEGEYASTGKKDNFHFEMPYTGYLEDHYDVSSVVLDIDDFYYEITEPNKLAIHIDILVDKLTEKPLIEETLEPIPMAEERDIRMGDEKMGEKDLQEEVKAEERENPAVLEKEEEKVEERVDAGVTQVFTNQSSLEDAYMTYKVYIVREGDTVSNILEKYQITEDTLRKYNVINELSLGDKLIIPHEKN